jgi:hypothetical protein
MPVPAVTCGPKIVIAWNEGGGTYTAALSAVATNSPTSWAWTILSVPVGLEALLAGTWGDFVDGVATAQNPSLPNIPTDVAAGTIVIQCVATNGTGPSVATIDRAAGQQCVVIQSATLALSYPGDRQYDWGRQLEATLRKVEEDTLAGFQRAVTTPVGLVLTTGNATYYDVAGLTLDVVVLVANETFLFLFEGAAARAAGSQVVFVQFMAGGVALNDPQGGFSSASNTALPVGTSWAHTFAAAGTYTVKIRIKYTGGYGPSTLWDGTLTVMRFRTPA